MQNEYRPGPYRRASRPRKPLDWLSIAYWASLVGLLVEEIRGTANLFLIGDYNFWATDLAVALAAFALIRSRLKMRLSLGGFICLGLGLIFSINLFRGVYMDAFQAFFGLRSTLFLILFLTSVLLATDRNDRGDTFAKHMAVGTIIISIVFVLRLIFGASLFYDTHKQYFSVAMDDMQHREIRFNSALFLSGSGVYFVYRSLSGRRDISTMWSAIFGIVAIMVVLFSRQRSATLGMLAGLVTLFVFAPHLVKRMNAGVMAFAVVTVTSLGVLTMIFDPVRLIALLPDEMQHAMTDTNTLDARHYIWHAALDTYRSWGWWSQLVGPEVGRRLNLIVQDRQWFSGLHSNYIFILCFFGAIGAVLWAVLLVGSVFQALRSQFSNAAPNGAGLDPPLALAWLAIVLVYGYSYDLRNSDALFVVLPLATWGGARLRRAPRRAAGNGAELHAAIPVAPVRGLSPRV